MLHLIGCTEGEVRLVDGRNEEEGRVEICLSNEWGTVCNQMWDNTDASVVCRQLELRSIGNYRFNNLKHIPSKVFSTGAVSLNHLNFGQGTGRIWLDNVQCTGSERELLDCLASSNGVNSCMHTQDVGVRCLPGKLATCSSD